MNKYEKEFAQQLKLEIEEQDTPTMIINGVPQETTKIKYVVMKCPSCDATIKSFQPGTSLVEVYDLLGKAGKINTLPKHCSSCGQKIMLDKSFVDVQTPTF